MNASKFRLESVNTMTVEIDGVTHRIHGENEITKREESSIRDAVTTAENIAEVSENLSFHARTIRVAK